MMIRLGSIALHVNRRALIFTGVSLLLTAVLGMLTLSLGELGVGPSDLWAALVGEMEGKTKFVLERLRGPRLATAVLVGALLGISGALFQGATRNPLGSPDVIGIAAGAKTGVAAMTLAPLWVPTPVGSAIGAGSAALIVYLSTGRGFRSPTRTIIAGIGVGALAHAVTHYIVSVKLRESAHHLTASLTGSLNAANARDIAVAGIALIIVMPLALMVSGNVSLLAMGDEVAGGLGGQPVRARTAAIVISVLAAASAVAAAGPIAFVALTSPQIAQRIVRSPDILIFSSAASGSLILVLADLAAQQFPLAKGLPVGVVTLGVGGIYLGYLLLVQHRKGAL